ncbi:MAG: Hpt domain-containing protein, partial [Isosphaeraceae bacterium]
MAGDDRFRLMFFEEARELLISLEEGLLELERRQEDRAHLDRVFRAAHSLKGAAAMVGLPPIAEFTHGIEAVLDRVRGGTLGIDPDLISTLLEARDHLAAMVESEAADAPIPAPADLNKRIAALLRDEKTPAAKPSPAEEPAPAAKPTPAPTPPTPPEVPDTNPAKPKGRARTKKASDGAAAKAKPRASRS